MATVKIEGSELELDDAICKTDKGLKDALAPYYPAVANASIKRETKGEETIITVTKQAGSKGHADAVTQALDNAPEAISELLIIETGRKRVNRKAMDEAMVQALDDEVEIDRAGRALSLAKPQSAFAVPTGF